MLLVRDHASVPQMLGQRKGWVGQTASLAQTPGCVGWLESKEAVLLCAWGQRVVRTRPHPPATEPQAGQHPVQWEIRTCCSSHTAACRGRASSSGGCGHFLPGPPGALLSLQDLGAVTCPHTCHMVL